MYRKFFGLEDLPFKSTPNIRNFFGEGSRQAIFEALLYTINRGDAIVKVTGEVGCGKTMTLRMLAEYLDDDFEIIYINTPNLSPKDMLFFICHELNLDVDFSLPKIAIISHLKEALISIHASSSKTVLLIDEAQTIPTDTLEELRLLSNLETEDDKLLQMVLFGQPELNKALENPEVRQLKSRITYSIELPPFTAREVQSYLNHRLRCAGYKGLDVFNLGAAKRIHRLTEGYPRGINEVADKLLMAMYGDTSKLAKSKHFKVLQNAKGPGFRVAFLLSVFGLVSLLAYLYIQHITSQSLDEFPQQVNTTLETPDVGDSLTEVSLPTALPETEVNQPQSLEKTNPSIKESNVVLNHIPQLVAPYHEDTVRLLNQSDDSLNVIQLATVDLAGFERLLPLLNRDAVTKGNIAALYFPATKNKKETVRVYLRAVDSFDELSVQLNSLSNPILRSKPFIIPVRNVLSGLNQIN